MRASKATVILAVTAAGVLAWGSPLSPVPSPTQNPPSEAKRVLGKILFWDERLSDDDTISCGSCHFPDDGGADPRRARHPGPDGVLGNGDDVFGSPGVVYRDANGNYARHAQFGFDVQVTGRSAPSFLTGALANSLFWDGRATSKFVDPQTGLVSIPAGGALESQAVGPILNTTEMGREGRTWDEVAAKLAASAPLVLATEVPPDVAAVLTPSTRYPDLFAAAFGDSAITAERIAFAIATYERTLVPDATPWDRFMDGDPTALSPAQQRGWDAFQESHCNDCHKAPEFTDRAFHNIGLRPASHDLGRNTVTGLASDAGRFRTPSLRNVNLRVSRMHTGQFTTLSDVLRFYARAPGAAPLFNDNLDPIMQLVRLSAQAAGDVQALLATGLTDPRSAAEEFPFDYPTPYSEARVNGPAVASNGRGGTGGFVPKMIAVTPPYLGNAAFRLGVANALGGAQAFLAVSSSAPVGYRLSAPHFFGPLTLTGSGAGGGSATMVWPVPDDASRNGEGLWFQWRVLDPAASGGVALSPVAAVTMFAVKSTSAAKPDRTDDSDLFVDAGAFSIDWRDHAKGSDTDSLSVSGVVHLGTASSVTGTPFDLRVGGVQLLATDLDARGQARSATGVRPAWTASVDPKSGRFTATVSGADLRPVVGLDSLSDRGTLQLDLAATLASTTARATVPFSWRTQAARLTRGTYRFARDGLVSGAFLAQSARVRAGTGTTSVTVTGSIDATGDAAYVPTGDLELVIGGHEVALPASSRTSRGQDASSTVRYAVTGTPQTSSVRFLYSARTRAFSLSADRLPATLLPQDGTLVASLPIELTTSDGLVAFATTVVVRRVSSEASDWRR